MFLRAPVGALTSFEKGQSDHPDDRFTVDSFKGEDHDEVVDFTDGVAGETRTGGQIWQCKSYGGKSSRKTELFREVVSRKRFVC